MNDAMIVALVFNIAMNWFSMTNMLAGFQLRVNATGAHIAENIIDVGMMATGHL